jgi:predicted nucleic acid-binding protein
LKAGGDGKMILYLDTSALVKRYFLESCSDDVISRWKSAAHIVTSFVAYAEMMAALYRKKREAGLADKSVRKIASAFHRDWQSFIRVEVNDGLNGYIDHVVQRYPVRGFDAIHLASAMLIHERFQEDFLFACFDDILVRAAGSEGIKTFPSYDD